MKILVTGGAGFIGSSIVDSLILHGHDVIIFDDFSTGKLEHVNTEATLIKVDIRSQEIHALLRDIKPEVVIHHAAQVSVSQSLKDPVLDQNVNIFGTVNLLEGSVKANVRKFVYASSAAVYGNPTYLPLNEAHPKQPTSFYGLSKYVPESYIKLYSEISEMDYCIFRYANVYGPRQDPFGEGGVISIFTNKLLKNEVVTVYGDGNQTRDFIFVQDIVDANLAALHSGSKQTINISTGQSTSLNRLIEIMSGLNNKPLTIEFKEEREGDIKHSSLDNSLAKELLLWSPKYSLESGLKLTIDHYIETEKYVETRG